jgi:hypothetical protein
MRCFWSTWRFQRPWLDFKTFRSLDGSKHSFARFVQLSWAAKKESKETYYEGAWDEVFWSTWSLLASHRMRKHSGRICPLNHPVLNHFFPSRAEKNGLFSCDNGCGAAWDKVFFERLEFLLASETILNHIGRASSKHIFVDFYIQPGWDFRYGTSFFSVTNNDFITCKTIETFL